VRLVPNVAFRCTRYPFLHVNLFEQWSKVLQLTSDLSLWSNTAGFSGDLWPFQYSDESGSFIFVPVRRSGNVVRLFRHGHWCDEEQYIYIYIYIRLFVCSLFIDAASSSDYISPKGMVNFCMMEWTWYGKKQQVFNPSEIDFIYSSNLFHDSPSIISMSIHYAYWHGYVR
jgi:hypothetical protein